MAINPIPLPLKDIKDMPFIFQEWLRQINSLVVTGPIPVLNGGTGIASYNVGDLIYASGTTTLGKLLDVATGNVLLSGGLNTAPSWGKVGLTTHVTGTLPVANGGTNLTTIADASILVTNATNTITALTAGSSQGVRRNAGNTAWEVFTPSTTTGTITSVAETFTGGLISVAGSPITSSGTLALTVAGTSGGIPYFSGSTTWASSGILDVGQLVLGGGAGNAPIGIMASSTVGQTLRVTGASTYAWGALSLSTAAAITGLLPITNMAGIQYYSAVHG